MGWSSFKVSLPKECHDLTYQVGGSLKDAICRLYFTWLIVSLFSVKSLFPGGHLLNVITGTLWLIVDNS